MVFKMLDNGNEDAELLEFRMLIYWNWGCWFFGTENAGFAGIEDAGFIVFFMSGNGTEDADLVEIRMLISSNWGCWIIGIEDVDYLVLRLPI